MNWKKFKEMSLGRKLQWILQYYGVTIAVAAVAIFVGVVLIRSVFGPADAYAIRVMILDDRQSADICRAIGEDLREVLSGECDVTSYHESDAEQMQAFAIRLLTDHLDIVIAPAEQTEQLLQSRFLSGAMELEADAFYYEYTGGGPDSGDNALFLGVAASGMNVDNVPAAMDYFVRGR